MKYEHLTTEDQVQILASRMRQFEAEYFNHEQNAENLEASGETDEATKQEIKVARDAMKALDRAHGTAKAKLAKLKKPGGADG